MSPLQSDALVLFGITGDLAHKMVFPGLYALAKRGELKLPIIGVAGRKWTLENLHNRVRDSIERTGGIDNKAAFKQFISLFQYVRGDYETPDTFTAIKRALGTARSPAHYLAIPPGLFRTVIKGLGTAGLAEHARIIIEKPFGHNLASARALNRVAKQMFAEDAIFRIDHFLAKEAIMDIIYFRFANSFLRPLWDRNYVASVQITLAEKFGVGSRGAFYETAGCLRDVIQNHLFQIVTLLAMEPPANRSFDAIQNEKLKVFQAMRPLKIDDVVRGQYEGYRQEAHVAKNSDVETFCALRLFIDSWRWAGVPWYLRSGKNLSATETSVLVQFKESPQKLFPDAEGAMGSSNYMRFQLSPRSILALAARVKLAGSDTLGVQREFILLDEQRGGETPYERLLSDAMKGDRSLFIREDTVEAAWSVVEPALKHRHPVHIYKRGTWGPKKADALIATDGQWNNPEFMRQSG